MPIFKPVDFYSDFLITGKDVKEKWRCVLLVLSASLPGTKEKYVSGTN